MTFLKRSVVCWWAHTFILPSLSGIPSYSEVPPQPQLSEYRCQSLESWEPLDLAGDGREFVEKDASVPAGYGPDVIRISGKECLLLAKGVEFSEGTIAVLWKDEDPLGEDADGVLVFQADYPQDLEAARNIKEKRLHYWIEQDADDGFQIKHRASEERETTDANLHGVGMTQDEWNKTGWIWQKLRVREGAIEAKFWSHGSPEPAEWHIEIQNTKKAPGKVGVKVNSGKAAIAYFAVSPADFSPPIPRVLLHVSQPICYQPEKLTAALTFNLPAAVPDARIRIHFLVDGQAVPGAELTRNLPKGNSTLEFRAKEPLQIPSPLPQRPVVLEAELSDAGNSLLMAATREIEFRSLAQYQERIDAIQARIAQKLEVKDPREAFQPPSVATQNSLSALGHLDLAQARLSEGKVSEAERALGYAEEALDPNIHFSDIAADSVGLPAASLVMGQTYEIWLVWNSQRRHPTDPLTARLQITDDLRIETPLCMEVPLPVSEWRDTGRAQTGFKFRLQEEFPEGSLDPIKTPAIREGWHRIWITLLRADRSHEWLRMPDFDLGDFGTRYQIGRVYITQNRIEIGNVVFDQGALGSLKAIQIPLRNLSSAPLGGMLSARLLTESREPVWLGVRKANLSSKEESKLDFQVDGFHGFGPFLLETVFSQGQNNLTRAEARIELKPSPIWPGLTLSARRKPQVLLKGGAFKTQVEINAQAQAPLPGAIDVEIRKGSEDLGKHTLLPAGKKSIQEVFDVEPGFGSYVITAKIKDNRGEVWSREFQTLAPSFENRNGKLYLNGEPFIVKGVNCHSMISDSPERNRQLMRLLKDIGFNMLRGDYPPVWETEMAEEENLGWMVLAPFSVTDTDKLKETHSPYPFARMREITRRFIRTYRDKPAVWLWNSCNEITGEIDDFLATLFPVYKALDPAQRPVVYANLAAQDRTVGEDLMGVNYYYGPPENACDKWPLLDHSLSEGAKAGQPCLFTEFNCWYGPVYSRGAEAVRDLFEHGLELGMAGGFLFMLPEHPDRHPGVVDTRENLWTNPTFIAALRHAFDDASIEVAGRDSKGMRLRAANKRDFTLRKVHYEISEGGSRTAEGSLPDIDPRGSGEIPPLSGEPKGSRLLEVDLYFETHHGIRSHMHNRIPVE
jgi:hypothetical protein